MTGLAGYGEVLALLGFGSALGGLLGTSRYRGGLGPIANLMFTAMTRYGTVIGLIGAAVVLIGLAAY